MRSFDEEWRTCVDFPNYEVSSSGRVRRIAAVRGKVLKPGRHSRGYQQVNLRRDGKTFNRLVHRLVGKAFLGLTDGLQIDHQFHDLDDFSQIRVVTHAQNLRNSRGQKNRSSRFKGVSWSAVRKKWRADIKLDSRSKHLGCFESEIDAARAYDRAALAAWGSYAFLNFHHQQ
jgi:hypothetical protein